MKIAFANILYSKNHQRGGLGAHIATLSAELARRGHAVTVLTSGEGQPYLEDQVRIVPLGRIDVFRNIWQVLSPVYMFQRLAYMIRMTWYVKAGKFDIVETADGGFEQLFLAAFAKRSFSLVTKLHGNFRLIYAGNSALAALAAKAEAFVVRRSDGVYASSVHYAKAVAHDSGLLLERIGIIPYAVEIDEAGLPQPVSFEDRYPLIRGKSIVFLSAGSSPVRKGALLFLETAEACKRDDVCFVLSCNDRKFLEGKLIPQNVLLLANLDQSQFYSWLKSSDVVAFPSAGESFCIAVREAMLFGKSIVVSKEVPLEGIDLEYPKCAVMPRLQASHLAEAIFRFIDGQPESAEHESEFRERFARYYRIATIADQTEDFYRGLRKVGLERCGSVPATSRNAGHFEPDENDTSATKIQGHPRRWEVL